MNRRTAVSMGAVALLGVGLVLTIGELMASEAPEPRITVARASMQIEPGTVITQDMVRTGDSVRARDAQGLGAWEARHVAGKIARDVIAPGVLFTARNAVPVEAYRLSADLTKEILSFQAGVDRMVAGHLRPGHLVNLYGFQKGTEDETHTALLERSLLVVDVQQSSGQSAQLSTPQVDYARGAVVYKGDEDRPGTMVTVAVAPEVAFRIIDALGAQSYDPWLTLAASRSVAVGRPTTAPAAPPVGQPVPRATIDALATQVMPTRLPDVNDAGDGG